MHQILNPLFFATYLHQNLIRKYNYNEMDNQTVIIFFNKNQIHYVLLSVSLNIKISGLQHTCILSITLKFQYLKK